MFDLSLSRVCRQFGMMASMLRSQWMRPFVRLATCDRIALPPLLESPPEAIAAVEELKAKVRMQKHISVFCAIECRLNKQVQAFEKSESDDTSAVLDSAESVAAWELR